MMQVIIVTMIIIGACASASRALRGHREVASPLLLSHLAIIKQIIITIIIIMIIIILNMRNISNYYV